MSVAGGGVGVLVDGTVGVARPTWVRCAETVSAAAVWVTCCGDGRLGKLHDPRNAGPAVSETAIAILIRTFKETSPGRA